MRFVLWLGLILIFVSLGYMGSDFLTELSARTEAREMQARTDREHAVGVLKTHERYVFRQIVIGPGEEADTLDFRARAYRDDIAQSAYGTVRPTCPPPAEGPACWELATLFIDGVRLEEAAGQTSAPAPAPDQAALAPAPAADPAQPPVQPPVQAPAATPTPDPATGSSAAEALRPSHIVQPSLVNARTGPGGEVATQLEGGTPLMLLEAEGGWGRFQVLDGPETGRELWVAFSVLDAV